MLLYPNQRLAALVENCVEFDLPLSLVISSTADRPGIILIRLLHQGMYRNHQTRKAAAHLLRHHERDLPLKASSDFL